MRTKKYTHHKKTSGPHEIKRSDLMFVCFPQVPPGTNSEPAAAKLLRIMKRKFRELNLHQPFLNDTTSCRFRGYVGSYGPTDHGWEININFDVMPKKPIKTQLELHEFGKHLDYLARKVCQSLPFIKSVRAFLYSNWPVNFERKLKP
jgi:hypothetical protein